MGLLTSNFLNQKFTAVFRQMKQIDVYSCNMQNEVCMSLDHQLHFYVHSLSFTYLTYIYRSTSDEKLSYFPK